VIDTRAVVDTQSPQGQVPEAQPRAEDPQQRENAAEDAGQTEGTAAAAEKSDRMTWRDKGRIAAGIMAAVVAVGLLAWPVFDQLLPLWAVVAVVILGAVAAGSSAWLLVPRTIDPRLKRAIEVGVTVIALIAALLAITRINSKPPKPQPPSEVLFDDFNSGTLDADKWTLAPVNGADPFTLREHIYVRDGKLHIKVSPDYFSSDSVNAELRANVPSDWIITKISVKMTLESPYGLSAGAAYFSISSVQDRESRAWMGPNSESEPTLGYKFCEKMDTDCNIVGQHEIEEGQEYQVEAVTSRKDPKFWPDRSRFQRRWT
jgi:hypothetical protein